MRYPYYKQTRTRTTAPKIYSNKVKWTAKQVQGALTIPLGTFLAGQTINNIKTNTRKPSMPNRTCTREFMINLS